MSFPAILAFEDGSVFQGIGYGKEKYDVGEIVFNTSMSGYQEIITDPSYKKQIITFTHPHIGNTGTNKEDSESEMIHASGIVVKNFCEKPSNWRSSESLEEFLLKHDVMAISGVDTRQITSILREKGAQNCCIGALSKISEKDAIQKAKNFSGLEGLDLAKVVSTKENYLWDTGVWPHYAKSTLDYPIVAMDFGIKKNILNLLSDTLGKVHVVNAQTEYNEIKKLNPKGIFLSNGPGDPAIMKDSITKVKNILSGNIPVFGICLGHQAIALSEGIKTYKMHNGHRGINHPVINIETGKCEVTSQNHGFGIDANDVNNNENVKVTHRNLNDDTIEGIKLLDKNAFSVQYHPESSPGPHDSRYLFDQFISNIKIHKNS